MGICKAYVIELSGVLRMDRLRIEEVKCRNDTKEKIIAGVNWIALKLFENGDQLSEERSSKTCSPRS